MVDTGVFLTCSFFCFFLFIYPLFSRWAFCFNEIVLTFPNHPGLFSSLTRRTQSGFDGGVTRC